MPLPRSRDSGFFPRADREVLEWAKRAPMPDGDVIEVRQVQEMSEFPPELQKAAGSTRLGKQ